MFSVLRILTRGMLRTTVTKIGVSDSKTAIRLSIAGIVATVVVSNILGIVAVNQVGQVNGASPAPFAVALLWAQSAGIIVLVQNIGIGQSTISRGLQLVPLSPAERVAATSLPLFFVAGLSCATMLLPAAAIVWDHTALNPVFAVLLCLVASVTGACAGFLAWAGAAVACGQSRFFVGRTYPVSVLLLVCIVSLSLPILGELTGQAPDDATTLPAWVAAVYVWPSIASFTLDPDPYWLGLIITIGTATIIWTGVTAVRVAPYLLRDDTPHPRRFRWNPARRFPLYRLEIIRLLRNRRNVTAIATAVVMAAVGVMAAALNERRGLSDVDVAPVIGILMTVPTSQITLLARGLTQTKHPYHLQLGYSPKSWTNALNGAAITIAVATVAPLMVALWFAPGVDPVALGVVCCYQALVYVGTSVFGAVVRPGRDNPAGEFIGLLLVSGAAAAMLTSLVGRYGGNHPSVFALTLGLVVALAPLPAMIEQRRWTQLIKATTRF